MYKASIHILDVREGTGSDERHQSWYEAGVPPFRGEGPGWRLLSSGFSSRSSDRWELDPAAEDPRARAFESPGYPGGNSVTTAPPEV